MSHETEQEIQRALGRIESGQAEVMRLLTAQKERADNHAGRIRKLELWRSWTTGISVGVATLFAAVRWYLGLH
jgi:hypothetical protein